MLGDISTAPTVHYCAPTATWQSRLPHNQHIAFKSQDMSGTVSEWQCVCLLWAAPV